MINFKDIEIHPQVLGEGQHAPVLKGRYRYTDVAVKKIHCKNKQHRNMIMNEIGLPAFVNHRNICRIEGAAEQDNTIYLIMEYMDCSLSDYIVKLNKASDNQNGAAQFPPDELLSIALDVARGMNA